LAIRFSRHARLLRPPRAAIIMIFFFLFKIVGRWPVDSTQLLALPLAHPRAFGPWPKAVRTVERLRAGNGLQPHALNWAAIQPDARPKEASRDLHSTPRPRTVPDTRKKQRQLYATRLGIGSGRPVKDAHARRVGLAPHLAYRHAPKEVRVDEQRQAIVMATNWGRGDGGWRGGGRGVEPTHGGQSGTQVWRCIV